ncbi:hypothetical protein [Nonomuraea sp. NPDC049400]|uniref:hypothetical protein n=1 Tax=Nonomuraea sp. NPDC049400 TaxID=3364352 RepID=UPI003792FE4B
MQYRVISQAGPGGALAQSLPASAANVGIAFGSFADRHTRDAECALRRLATLRLRAAATPAALELATPARYSSGPDPGRRRCRD